MRCAPRPRLNSSARTGCIRALRLGMLVALAILVSCSGNSPARVVRGELGQKVKVGGVAYTVLDADWTEALGNGANARIPTHLFLLLRVSASDESGEPEQMGRLTLIATDGTEYDEIADGSGVNEWLGMSRGLRGKSSLQGVVLFDAPKAVYQLQVADEFYDGESGSAALIHIPIRPAGVEPAISGALP